MFFLVMFDIFFWLQSHEGAAEVFLILASFAGWAVSLCALGAAVQTHAKLTMASSVISIFHIKPQSTEVVL